MRRSDREIKDFDEIVNVIRKCQVCRLALNDKEYPYIFPVNFGMEIEDGKIVLYFHSAMEGTKRELMKQDSRASFEMDCDTELVTILEDGNCTMNYESVIGQGYLEEVPEKKKYEALCILMKHYHKEDFPFNQKVIPRTFVYRMVVEHVTGKRRRKMV